jgi:DMSO reductase family type II enzyme heme b subunit
MYRTAFQPALFTLCFFLLSGYALAANPRAEKLYDRHCAACHGVKGDGAGPAAYLLSPKPRDFTAGVYKFRSTPSGAPPTDQDLIRTLKRGIPGTAMPAWDRLSGPDLASIVGYVKSFSDIFEDPDAKEAPITIKAAPPMTPESTKAGQKVYEKMECERCHGPGGKGDGPTASELRDDLDRPIRPYDFTRGPGMMKGGGRPEEIYRTFITGIGGTPMPSFVDELNENESWQLVHYIQSLSSGGEVKLSEKGTPTLHAVRVSADPPLDPADPVWKRASATTVSLRPLWARDNWVYSVKVQSAVGPTMVAFRFEWRDPQKDEEVIRPRDFRDALAIQFAPQGKPSDYVGIPFIGMGDKKNTVTIWHWKADWEADIRRGFRDSVDHMDQMAKPADFKTNKRNLAGLAAANPLSDRKRKSSVEVLMARGFGTLTNLPANQTVQGRGLWLNGKWVVIMRQALLSPAAPPLRRGRPLPVAVAVWEGSAGDRNGQKAVSQWMEFIVK